MKWISLLVMIGIFGLAACAPVTNQAVPTTPRSPAQATAPPGATTAPEPTVSPPSTQPATKVVSSLAWETNPNTKVIVATFCCGLAPDLLRLNYLPVAQVWGDGHILWTKSDSEGHRHVLEGMLSQDQMSALLQEANSQGFFEWKELYKSPDSPTDLPPKCISIQLKDLTHRVCEYQKGAPPAFHDLYNTLENGDGLVGKDYQPTKGFLISHPQSASYKPASDSRVPVWDAKSTNLSFSQAINGVWVDGKTLATAWELLNSRPIGSIIMDDGAYYQLSLQIPGVSMIEPPAP